MRRILALASVVWLDMLRRKDIYVLAGLLLASLAALMSFRIFSLGGLVSHVKELGLLGAWLLAWILAVMTSVRQIPQEESRGTIFSLLARPVTRFEFLAGKWLGTWSLVGVATAAFYVMVWIMAALRGGAFAPTVLAQALALHLGFLAVVIAAGLLFSTRLNADAAGALTALSSLASFALVPRIPEIIAYAAGWRQIALLIFYHVLPRLEIFDLRQRLVHNWGPAPAGAFFLVLAYAAVETALLLLLAWLLYRNKRFSRTSLL
jgi:ABC-type Na+ efflux pump permease subunit